MNQFTALREALYLAIIAPTDDKAQQAIELAARISVGMNPYEVEEAKAQAAALAGTA